jgi:hypothetical protein
VINRSFRCTADFHDSVHGDSAGTVADDEVARDIEQGVGRVTRGPRHIPLIDEIV